MAIKFACEKCGKSYSVPDDSGGKRFKCRECQTVGTVPGGDDRPTPAPGPAAAAQGAACPACAATLAPGAVFCVQCGYDMRAGRIGGAAEPQDRPPRKVPVKLLLVLGVGVVCLGLVGATVFGVVRFAVPVLLRAKIDDALDAAAKGEFADAVEELEGLQGKIGGKEGDRAARLAAMIRLQEQTLFNVTEPVGTVVVEGASLSTTETRPPRMLVKVIV